MVTTTDVEQDIERLRIDLTGELFTPEEEGFIEATALWNAAIKPQTRLTVLPETIQDVVQTVLFARQHGLPLAVRGGGHDWAGRATVADGIQLNMRRMNTVQVDAIRKTATVGGGTTGIELSQAAALYELVAATPTVGDVGFTGWTLGGGYGPISPSVGLGIDNVLSVEMVLADGTVVTASAQEHPELFWAIRGGGGNFGVVTSLHIQLHEVKPLLTGMIQYNAADAQQVLSGHNQLMAKAPNELAVSAAMMYGPDGQLVVSLLPFWFGDQQQGEECIDTMQQFAPPLQAQVGPMTYSAMLELQSSFIPKGFHWAIQTRWLPTLEPDQIQLVSEALRQTTSPFSFVNIHHFHGASLLVGGNETPFPLRKPHFMVEIIAAWETKDDHNSQQHQQWASKLSDELKEKAYPGGYANLLGPAETEQISHAYGDNLDRLQRVKQLYDPKGVFTGIALPG